MLARAYVCYELTEKEDKKRKTDSQVYYSGFFLPKMEQAIMHWRYFCDNANILRI